MTNNAVKLGRMPSLQWVKIEDLNIPEGRLKSHFKHLRHFDFERSIEAEGVIQPIYVFRDENGVLWLADGQNRLETLRKDPKRFTVLAYVMHGSKQDAILYSAKLNVLRGKVNVGELAEFVLNLHKSGMKLEDIAESLRLSKGYISQLITIAQNVEILEKVKKGLISKIEAYESAKGLLSKQVSQETKEPTISVTESLPSKPEPKARHPLTDEDLGFTSLKEAMETGKRFKPLYSEPSQKKTEYMTCDFCGKILSRLDVKWIKIHSDEYDKVLLAIKKLAEREAQNESSQP
ncbi:MAG: ParB/RepB/Spo0J family partition protein [Candidatus Bathycorpusculaceae bacterium]